MALLGVGDDDAVNVALFLENQLVQVLLFGHIDAGAVLPGQVCHELKLFREESDLHL